MEEIENTAIFPTDTGQFRSPQISAGMTYEVHGERKSKDESSPSPQIQRPCTPYGSYPSPLFASSQSFNALQQPPPRMPKKAIRKAVSLVSLTAADPTKASSSKVSRLEYSIVTQVFLCLTPEQCNINSMSDLVARQVGFPDILLDSKCYSLSNNSGTIYWIWFLEKQRKFLPASKSLYEELTGHSTTIDSNLEAMQPPPAKKQRQEDMLIELEKVTAIDKKVSLPSELSKALQCSICKGIALPPVVSSCCQRVVACLDCNRTWRSTCDRCPLCNTTSQVSTHTFELRGFEDVVRHLDITSFQEPRVRTGVEAAATPNLVDIDSGDDFEDSAPNYRASTN